MNGTRLAITTDSFVVKPLRFPGGSIGELAVYGTVNDLAVSGARAETLVVTFVLEAGLPTEILEYEVRAMAAAARRAGVVIAGGDTKVVEHGKADYMYIGSCGIGRLIDGVEVSPESVRPGDRILLSGADRRPWHHHSAGQRRTGFGSRGLFRHAPGVAIDRSHGGCGRAGHSLDARSYARRSSYFAE
jgi:hydrogenase expression/formation protein HypE